MLTHKTLTNGDASITIDVDGTTYVWSVGGLADIEDVSSHLEANADLYRADVRTHLSMGLPVKTVTPPSLSDLKAAACTRIEAQRLTLEQAGVWINWPDGTRSKIQTRDERDWRNINGVASRGLARLTQNLTDEDWFRDADNVDHALLPSQALDLGYQASAAISIIARVAQAAKDAINADTVTTAEQVAAIEAGVVWP